MMSFPNHQQNTSASSGEDNPSLFGIVQIEQSANQRATPVKTTSRLPSQRGLETNQTTHVTDSVDDLESLLHRQQTRSQSNPPIRARPMYSLI